MQDRIGAGGEQGMSMRLNGDADLARSAARDEVESSIRELAANIMRVCRGAGSAQELAAQAKFFLEAQRAYREAFGRWVPSRELQQMLNPKKAWQDYHPSSADREFDEIDFAQDAICRAALQVTASQLLVQNPQKASGEKDITDAIVALERARGREQSKRAVV